MYGSSTWWWNQNSPISKKYVIKHKSNMLIEKDWSNTIRSFAKIIFSAGYIK
jgi:hypothetical protein